ncbi:MAG: sporulation membrane protein YtaF [Bacillota bacterium]
MLHLLLISLSLSLDSFAAGISYGAQKIAVPLRSRIIMGITSAAVLFFAMVGGGICRAFLPPGLSKLTGALLLTGIGICLIRQYLKMEDKLKPGCGEYSFRIPFLDLVVKILYEPATADRDHSGGIGASEAVLLGLALSIDAFGAGIGLALSGVRPLYIPLMAGIFQFVLFILGLQAGKSAPDALGRLKFIPGLIIIVLGISRFF